MKDIFRRVAAKVSYLTGTATAFLLATAIIVIWAVTGPAFHYSNTWQLVINTGTTIVTFWMVFLIQNTQNRDSKAMHLKLDELIRVSRASNTYVDIEELSDEELEQLDNEFRKLHDQATHSPVMHKLHERIEAEHQRRQDHKRSFAHPFSKQSWQA